MKKSIIIVLVIGVIICGGLLYLFWNQSKNQQSVETAQDFLATTGDTKLASTIPSDWIWYKDSSAGIAFAHPKNWRVKESKTTHCSPIAAIEFDASSCPLSGRLRPKNFTGLQAKKYNRQVDSIVRFELIQDSSKSFNELYRQFKLQYVSEAGYQPKPTTTFNNKGHKGFYINQKTNSYSDNLYVIELDKGKYLFVMNRESDKHYTTGGVVDDQNDYTEHSPTVDRIVKTIKKL